MRTATGQTRCFPFGARHSCRYGVVVRTCFVVSSTVRPRRVDRSEIDGSVLTVLSNFSVSCLAILRFLFLSFFFFLSFHLPPILFLLLLFFLSILLLLFLLFAKCVLSLIYLSGA